VFDTYKLCDVIEMIQHMFDRRWLFSLHEHSDARDSHHTAACGHFLNRFVGF
jgi:hypothetical protein